MLLTDLLLASLLCLAVSQPESSMVSAGVNSSCPGYLHIGDGTAQEFLFPEKKRGIIVIASRYINHTGLYHRPTLTVASLQPAVLTIENVTDASRVGQQGSSYVINIRSGIAGVAPLLVQLLDEHMDARQPVVIEERRDFSIKVAPNEDTLAWGSGGLGHFSENPVLYVLLPLIFINKCAFGCKVEEEVLRGLLRQPQPVLLGIFAQFVVMPLYAYILSLLFALDKPLALGLVMTCSSPGGGGGYLYSLLLGGDVTLAISMTLLSTVAATGLMPLSSALYSRLLGVHETLHVPFLKILVTLLFIAIPISTGLVVKCHLPRVSRGLLLLIKPFSFMLIVGGLFMAYQMGAFILADVRPSIVLAGVSVPLFGLVLGYILARCLGLVLPHRRTVSIEVGVQNSLLALAVLQLSFHRAEADYASQAPFIVALSSTSEMLFIVIMHLVYKRLFPAPE
ncbi:P3 protein [Ambystoma mexicanum]|uniref:P3 protein n=1 Tax=Ambystoma mexicanum TaxID=8296 RepID=UPI0037E9B6E3